MVGGDEDWVFEGRVINFDITYTHPDDVWSLRSLDYSEYHTLYLLGVSVKDWKLKCYLCH